MSLDCTYALYTRFFACSHVLFMSCSYLCPFALHLSGFHSESGPRYKIHGAKAAEIWACCILIPFLWQTYISAIGFLECSSCGNHWPLGLRIIRARGMSIISSIGPYFFEQPDSISPRWSF
ncbi:hypothetical protein DFH11DRAFT_1618835 [Phellopilus nigrolimitatus]|nr:hypothetical protein DFH11DRAFT_1618835 [Phellopilus nigrolimitatus]